MVSGAKVGRHCVIWSKVRGGGEDEEERERKRQHRQRHRQKDYEISL